MAILSGLLTDAVAQSQRSLLEAVQHFQSIWGVDISYASNTLDDHHTLWDEPAAPTAEEDLKNLLKGTGVTFFRQAGGTFFLEPIVTRPTTLTGSIHAKETGYPLRGVHISLVGTSEGTVSDLDGKFILSTTAQDSIIVRFSHVGYLHRDLALNLPADSTLAVYVSLSEWVMEQFPLEVIASALPSEFPFLIYSEPYEMDIRKADDLRQIIGIGTPDIVRNLADVAGLYIDLSTSDIHIQGSGLGEHQFRLDGNAVFEPIHLGLFGIFNPFAIDQITVQKAGFDVEHGSYLAGIINAEHSLESDQAVALQIDPISFNARITNRMDFPGSSLSIMGAFRNSIWDHWLSNLRSESVNELLMDWNRPDQFLMRASVYPLKRFFEQGYTMLVNSIAPPPAPSLPDINFKDIHAATQLVLDDGAEAGISIYTGKSRFEGRLLSAANVDRTTPPDRHTWMNRSVRIYWEQDLTETIRWRATWRRGTYAFSHTYGGLDRQNSVQAAFNLYRYNSIETSDENGISNNDVGLSLHHSHVRGFLRMGVDLSWIRHNFSIQHVLPRVLNHERRSLIASGYAQHAWNPVSWAELTTGFRFTWLRVQSRWHIEPRTALLLKSPYKDGYGVSLRLATGIYYQFLNQFEIATISPSSIVPSTRFWIPVDETYRAPISNHYSIDLSAQLFTHWQVGFEYYYKDQRRLYRIDYPKLWRQDKDTESVIQSVDQFVHKTSGFVSGASAELRRNGTRLQLALRLERSESKREYAFRNSEIRLLPVPWNVPQQLQFKVMYKPIPALEGSMRWQGAWGRQWGYKRAYYDLLGSDIDHAATYDEFSFVDPTAEGHELAPFVQLDLGISVIIHGTSSRKFQVRVDLLNAMDRENPAYRYLQEQGQFGTERQVLVNRTSYLIGRTFTLSAQLQW